MFSWLSSSRCNSEPERKKGGKSELDYLRLMFKLILVLRFQIIRFGIIFEAQNLKIFIVLVKEYWSSLTRYFQFRHATQMQNAHARACLQ